MGSPDSNFDMIFAIGFYMMCSSVMLVANKVAVTWVPLPGLMVCCQFVVTVICIYARIPLFGAKVEPMTFSRIWIFLPYVVSMSMCIFSNVKSLHYSNVETVITFRACSPICVSLLDWIFLGRELPSQRSALSLLVVFIGAIIYVMTDSEFKLNGLAAYTWVFIYFVAIVSEMTYGKKVMSRMSFEDSVWGSTFYTNVLCLPPMLALAIINDEPQQLQQLEISFAGAAAVFFTCVVGVCISWAGWNCREKTSATSFTLIGVTCKLITVIINVIIWDKHASGAGLACLCICIGASTAYRQAPLRPVLQQAPAKAASGKALNQELDDELDSELYEVVGTSRSSA